MLLSFIPFFWGVFPSFLISLFFSNFSYFFRIISSFYEVFPFDFLFFLIRFQPLLPPSPIRVPPALSVIGSPLSGKSTVARKLSASTGAIRITAAKALANFDLEFSALGGLEIREQLARGGACAPELLAKVIAKRITVRLLSKKFSLSFFHRGEGGAFAPELLGKVIAKRITVRYSHKCGLSFYTLLSFFWSSMQVVRICLVFDVISLCDQGPSRTATLSCTLVFSVSAHSFDFYIISVIRRADCLSRGWIFDGYPASVADLKALQAV